MARGSGGGQRRMGGTWYTRVLIRHAEDRTERRKVTYARRLYNQRAVYGLEIRDAAVTATVQGTQLDPFAVILRRPAADPETVLGVLAAQGAIGEIMAVPRGELGRVLGGLVLPESASDIAVDCTCPDESGACAHALAVTYEAAAAMDVDPGTLLAFAGVPVATLLARTAVPGRSGHSPVEGSGAGVTAPRGDERATAAGYFGDGHELPPLPEPAPVDPIELLDGAVLRTALRRSGTRAGDLVQATEELAELYGRLREPREAP